MPCFLVMMESVAVGASLRDGEEGLPPCTKTTPLAAVDNVQEIPRVERTHADLTRSHVSSNAYSL